LIPRVVNCRLFLYKEERAALYEKVSAPDRAKREAQMSTLKETMRGEDLIEGEYRDAWRVFQGKENGYFD